jgi:hypothetical protein
MRFFLRNPVQRSGYADRCERPVAARIYDADFRFGIADIFVEFDNACYEALTEFVFIDRDVRPDVCRTYGTAGRADNAFHTGSDFDPDRVFQAASSA